MQPETITAEVKKPNVKKRRGWKIHLLPIPALVIYGLFIVYPLLAALTYSFFDWEGIKQGAFIGLGNYKDLFTLEPFRGMFWNAFGHNVLYSNDYSKWHCLCSGTHSLSKDTGNGIL